MSILVTYFEMIMELFDTPMTIYGFTFSFWDIFKFCIFASLFAYLVGGIYGTNN